MPRERTPPETHTGVTTRFDPVPEVHVDGVPRRDVADSVSDPNARLGRTAVGVSETETLRRKGKFFLLGLFLGV